MDNLFWYCFYLLYFIVNIRFLIHKAPLAFPIPPARKYRRTKLDITDKILIQYPIRNEPKRVIARFFKTLYSIPEEERHRFKLQVLDDYDKYPENSPSKWGLKCPVNVQYLKRRIRTGNKAGNLNYGLLNAKKEYKWVMIYDSDHQLDGKYIIEACEILKANPKICCVQSRWIQNNLDYSLLANLQNEVITCHLEREQTFRSYWNLYPIFNGAGAIWNRSIVEKECGGWLERCVCEDTDISGVMNMRGYKIHVLPKWVTKVDAVLNWKEYRKQQKRWIKGNGQQLQFHCRENKGWGLKKLFWISWNMGFALSFSKYLIPFVMFYKWFYGMGFYWFEWAGLIPHFFGWVASLQNWENKVSLKRWYLYPLHYFTEHGALIQQTIGFWQGFIFWNKHHEFEVTKK